MQPDLPPQTPSAPAKEEPGFETPSFNLTRLGGHTMQDVAQEFGEALEKAVKWLFSGARQLGGMAARGGAALTSAASSLLPERGEGRDRGESSPLQEGRSLDGHERSPAKALSQGMGISAPSKTRSVGEDCSLADDLGYLHTPACPDARATQAELHPKHKRTHEH
ncbi:MAG: hypothetical protein J0L97_11225 [Alphaproteobacteria bacterium]|nr:hypothetical protein [Alphaproteobacteria bacterium]